MIRQRDYTILFFFFFFLNYLYLFYFLILSWLKIQVCNFFSFKIIWIATIFFYMVFLFYFFRIIFKIVFVNFNFLIYKVKTCRESIVVFLIYYYRLLQYFPLSFFFCFFSYSTSLFFFFFFSKIIFVNFTFLILSRLKIQLCNCFPLKYCRLLRCFPTWFFYFIFL